MIYRDCGHNIFQGPLFGTHSTYMLCWFSLLGSIFQPEFSTTVIVKTLEQYIYICTPNASSSLSLVFYMQRSEVTLVAYACTILICACKLSFFQPIFLKKKLVVQVTYFLTQPLAPSNWAIHIRDTEAPKCIILLANNTGKTFLCFSIS